MKTPRELAQDLLTPAGITLNGPNPWDPQIHDDVLFERLFSQGVIAVGEGYMEGLWDVADLPNMVARVINAQQMWELLSLKTIPLALSVLRSKLFNLQSSKRAFEVGEKHYDIGNDIYERMLDKRLTYSCGYWSSPQGGAKTLEEAQEAKLDLICRKIGLKKGDRILDIGCGWGSFAIYAAEKYGASVVGVTVSVEQAALARERAKGLPVEIRVQDYREISDGPFDHVVSIGMFEHVGPKNYRSFMQLVRRLLKKDGLFLLHTIGARTTYTAPDPWIDKYIFPNGMLPSAEQVMIAANEVFLLEDWHNFGTDYDKTLMAWFANFDARWPEISEKYGQRFYRMWTFYLKSMAGVFRAHDASLWQIVLSPRGVDGGYTSIR
ncbi:MAG: cyclopropane fatty acyl phospholipid synthase [Candidatus Paceibacterota bacterium]